MKTVNSINFVVRESKTRRNGTAPIEVNLNKNGERASFSTGKSIKVSEWDKVSQRVRGKDRVSMELNNYLDSIRARLYRLEIELMDRGMDITVNMLRDAYMGKLDCMKDWSSSLNASIRLSFVFESMGCVEFGLSAVKITILPIRSIFIPSIIRFLINFTSLLLASMDAS